MTFPGKLLDKLSDLSRLKFEGEERLKMKQDLEKMLDFVNKLSELDTEGVEPLKYMMEEPLKLREDSPSMNTSQQDALRNAPSKDSDYFKVPKVLDKK